MPPIGLVLGRVNFNDLFFSPDDKSCASLTAAKAAGTATINYGVFINTIFDFIIAFTMFMLVRQTNASIHRNRQCQRRKNAHTALR